MAIALIGLGCTTCALAEYEASRQHFRKVLHRGTVDGLVGLARLLTANDLGEAAAEQTVELLEFVLHRPISSRKKEIGPRDFWL